MRWAALCAALVLTAQAACARPIAALSRGARLALQGADGVVPCAVCHGARGQGRPHFAYPHLAGLGAPYVLDTLRAFADGRRLNGIMTPIARRLSAQAMRSVALYYAQFRPRPPHWPGSLSLSRLGRGRRYYQYGALSDHLIACARCHGRRGHGQGARFPWIAGQSRAYLIEQLRSFQAGARTGHALGLMRHAARPLSRHQIADIALYVRLLGARPPLALRPHAWVRSARPIVPRGFMPPPRAAIPATVFGRAARRGRAIFDDTPRYARAYVGNALSCRDCHLGEGRAPHAGPLWAAAALYPRVYRGRVTTLAQRIRDAFAHSEAGRAPPLASPVLTDLLAYIHWMSRGEVIGAPAPGRGYPSLAPLHGPPDSAQGAVLYHSRCAVCHGERGAGRRYNGRLVFPPVLGAASYGRTASLAQEPLLAAFLKATMPYGEAGTLSRREAYDLAAYLDAAPQGR